MAIITSVALVLLAQGPVATAQAPDTAFDVGYEELVANDNAAARQAIENCDALAANDPARLINHGIALARMGNYDAARTEFSTAANMRSSVELEQYHSGINPISPSRGYTCEFEPPSASAP